jgi:hypothetical protein
MALISDLRTVPQGMTWKSWATARPSNPRADLTGEDQAQVPVASAVLELPSTGPRLAGTDPGYAELILHVDLPTSDLAPGLPDWRHRFVEALVVPGELARLLQDLGLAVPSEPPAQVGVLLHAGQAITEIVSPGNIPVLPAYFPQTVKEFTGFAVAAPDGKTAEETAGQMVLDLSERDLHLNGSQAEMSGQMVPVADSADATAGPIRAGSPKAVPSQPVRLLPRPRFLAGRKELLADVDRLLTGVAMGGPHVVVLCGLGGAGKTSVALEYAYRHLAGSGLVWQFVAEEPTALTAGFGELAAELGVRDLLSAGDPIAQVHGVLAARTGDWILLFDNAPGPAALQHVLPPLGRGQVIVTSQNPHWPGRQVLPVPELGQETAADFLQFRKSSADWGAAMELAAELGGLPLALEQAAAYMQATGRDIAGCLTLFRKRCIDLLKRGEPAGYEKQVATTWTLAFDQLEQTAPVAIGLLRLLACCAPEQIPLRLLLKPLPRSADSLPADLEPILADPVAADDAVAALRRFSLISPPHDGMVSVHRLVQAVTLGGLADGQASAWREAAQHLIEAAIPADPREPDAWPDFAVMLSHAKAALNAESEGMGRIASYLGYRGNYPAATELYKEVIEARIEVLGAERPETLTARANLAYWTGHAGDAAGARDQYAALLPVRERVSGPEHRETLTARANLARWTGEAGDAVGARDQYAALLPIQEEVFGPDDPATLTARANLAGWTGDAGDPVGARDQIAALLPIRERVSGPDDPETLAARHHLAYWTGKAGDATAARDQFAALLADRERVLDTKHPDTLLTRANLASWTGQAGDPAGARDQYAALLPIRTKILGPQHPRTLTTRGSLADWTGEAGDAAGARDQYAALLATMEQAFGPEDPRTLTTRSNLARWTGEAGDAAAARDGFEALLQIADRVLGHEHSLTRAARTNLAAWTAKAADSSGLA